MGLYHTSLNRIERILRLLSFLQSGPSYNAEQLAQELEVSRRTIFRDLGVMRSAGIPVFFNDDTEGYSIPPQPRDRSKQLDDEELAILSVMAQLSPLEAIHGLGTKAHEALAKLQAALPEEQRLEISRLISSFSAEFPQAEPSASATDALGMLFEAVRKRLQVRIETQDADSGTPFQTQLSPFRISYADGRWQVTGRSTAHEATRTFDLDKITNVELTTDPYTVPRGFKSHS
jgi:predicted DNA-binding transcriptional regulator YafY